MKWLQVGRLRARWEGFVFDFSEHLQGLMIGTAVGDAIGLPREGLSRRRAARMFGPPPLGHRLFFRRGMFSDDTEHTCMAAQALLVSGGEPSRFARSMAWRLRWWLIGLPAGVGMATAKACLKLWIGFPPSRSGVWSAGNGPAMRAAILGAYAWDDLSRVCDLNKVSVRLTHTDPAAEQGALAIALAAAWVISKGTKGEPLDAESYLKFARPWLAGAPIAGLVEQVIEHVRSGKPLQHYLEAHGLERGVSGYINHTVPVCLFCWLAHPQDFRAAVEEVVTAGGDTDSTGAIVGALAGLHLGPEAIPPEWTSALIEWPRNIPWIKRLAVTLAAEKNSAVKLNRSLPIFWPGLLGRNALFLCVVLFHGVRRLLPPY